ncbi:Lipoyl synthase [anaerobic digester metagenome]
MQRKKPEWLKVSFNNEAVEEVALLMRDMKLNTVCKEANCPNLGECYSKKTATFMIMGSQCTRNCRFCNVTSGKPHLLDPDEPLHLAEAVERLGLEHVVITQVTRDDLPDGGAAHMAETVRQVKKRCPGVTIEVLISDLLGNREALTVLLGSNPDVLNHNVEMAARLYPMIRPQAKYQRSLQILADSKAIAPDILTKTGFMIGLGETDLEISELMKDVRSTGCDILTISQYLQPSAEHWPLDRFVEPAGFDRLKAEATAMGFRYVASSPLVRSSYRAQEALVCAKQESRISE